MRIRLKECQECGEPKQVLYRCRYMKITHWVFLCVKCLEGVKVTFADTYQYGGTWKSKKR